MRSLHRPNKCHLIGPAAIAFGLILLASACGDDSSTASSTSVGSTTDPGSTIAAGSTTSAAAAPSTAAMADVTGTLSGSGATFPQAMYAEAITDFKKSQSGATITYGGGGSGKGRGDLQKQVVDYAGTDGLVAAADIAAYKGGKFLYIPTVVAPVTISFNLDSVTSLNFSPDVLAKIFQREIKTWDDPAILADNPEAKANLKGNITVVRRSDGSGTTQNFTIFLERSVGSGGSGIWKLKSGSTVDWPADTQAGNGNGGVAQLIKSTKGAIGYVDLSDAVATGLTTGSVKNKAGKFVAPTLDGASAALSGVTVNADLSYEPLWATGDTSYPITAPTWIIVYQEQTDKVKGDTLKAFLRFLLTDEQKIASTINYAPLPKALADQALAAIDSIHVPA